MGFSTLLVLFSTFPSILYYLAIKAAKAAKSGVNAVGSVRGCHDNDVRSLLQAVHEGQQLGDDATLHLAVGFLALWRDRVQLVDEDDGGRVLLGCLEGLAQVALGLARQFAHDLGPVDEEEEGARFVGHGSGNQGFASAWWTEQ